MKNNRLCSCVITALFLLILVLRGAAQPQPNVQPASPVTFSVSIPGQLNTKVVQQNATDGESAVYFNFKKTDGTTAFLFQLNKVSEYQWIQLKDQLTDSKILLHKNGFIYYAQSTEKRHIKGPDAQAYSQVYDQINSMINSIVITE